MAEFSYLFYTPKIVKMDEDSPFSPKEWLSAFAEESL